MFGIIHYEMFLAASIILNITPGSDTIYVLSRSIAQGRRTGIYSVLGTSAGCVVHTVLAALGLSVILAQSAVVFMMVKIAGSVYLAISALPCCWRKIRWPLRHHKRLCRPKIPSGRG